MRHVGHGRDKLGCELQMIWLAGARDGEAVVGDYPARAVGVGTAVFTVAAPLFGGYPALVVSNWPSPVIGGTPTRDRAGSNGGQSWIKPRLLPPPPRVDP